MKDLISLGRTALAVLVILGVTLLCFWPCLNNGFVNWDDQVHLYENPLVRSLSFANIHEMVGGFTSKDRAF